VVLFLTEQGSTRAWAPPRFFGSVARSQGTTFPAANSPRAMGERHSYEGEGKKPDPMKGRNHKAAVKRVPICPPARPTASRPP